MSYRKTKFMKVLEPIKKGAYFYFTIPYGIFYVCGAIAGYVRDKSYLCLGVSGAIGLVFILLGIGHMIDYKRHNVAIEAFYILVPLLVSLIVMILMACHYGIGAAFMPSGFVATAAGLATGFYIYSFIRDFGKQLLETGDARFLKGQYVYKKVMIDDNDREKEKENLLRNRNRSMGQGQGFQQGNMSDRSGNSSVRGSMQGSL